MTTQMKLTASEKVFIADALEGFPYMGHTASAQEHLYHHVCCALAHDRGGKEWNIDEDVIVAKVYRASEEEAAAVITECGGAA